MLLSVYFYFWKTYILIVSFTLVKYKTAFIPFAFLAMAIHRIPLSINRKCSFWKLMGSGKNGSFDLIPDLKRWALLACWDERDHFEHFNNTSFISKWWNLFTEERFTILCKPIASHGKWDGKERFTAIDKIDNDKPVAILTRASIRLTKLREFWSNVDYAASEMSNSDGYMLSFGVGEAPVHRQATFSIWKDIDSAKTFAYSKRSHSEVIRKTRLGKWYSEELFARFTIIDSLGTFNGINPIKSSL